MSRPKDLFDTEEESDSCDAAPAQENTEPAQLGRITLNIPEMCTLERASASMPTIHIPAPITLLPAPRSRRQRPEEPEHAWSKSVKDMQRDLSQVIALAASRLKTLEAEKKIAFALDIQHTLDGMNELLHATRRASVVPLFVWVAEKEKNQDQEEEEEEETKEEPKEGGEEEEEEEPKQEEEEEQEEQAPEPNVFRRGMNCKSELAWTLLVAGTLFAINAMYLV